MKPNVKKLLILNLPCARFLVKSLTLQSTQDTNICLTMTRKMRLMWKAISNATRQLSSRTNPLTSTKWKS